jgi:hypothetical protein
MELIIKILGIAALSYALVSLLCRVSELERQVRKLKQRGR